MQKCEARTSEASALLTKAVFVAGKWACGTSEQNCNAKVKTLESGIHGDPFCLGGPEL